MRLVILVLFLASGTLAFSQSNAPVIASSGKAEDKQAVAQPSPDCTSLAPDAKMSSPAPILPKTRFIWNGSGATDGFQYKLRAPWSSNGAKASAELFARNEPPKLQMPLSRWPGAQAEPIPTQWPPAKLEPIPTQWPNLKMLRVTGQNSAAPSQQNQTK
jgi:hypothetical protein